MSRFGKLVEKYTKSGFSREEAIELAEQMIDYEMFGVGHYIPEDEEEYDTPSATRGDYSPSNPWDAPGMSINDFI